MRALRFQFHPERVRISAEEILADLNYPAGAKGRRDARKPTPARRKVHA
jgi:hypothetical protein